MTKISVLFICSHNAARSQMAEAIASHFLRDKVEASSGGSKPEPIKKEAILVMRELGIDISHNRSKHLREFEGQWFDFAVTLCGDNEEFCPFFPDAREHLHHGVNDPPGIDGTWEERLEAYRRMRDDIRAWITKEFGGS